MTKWGKATLPLVLQNENRWHSSFSTVHHLQESYAMNLQVEILLIVRLDLPPRRSTVDTNAEIKTDWLIKRGKNLEKNLSRPCLK